MIETFTALLLAHALADFLFQPDSMARNKARPSVMLLHGLIVLATAQMATGQPARLEILALALVHVAIDGAKIALRGRGLAAFLIDQAAHLASLAALALYVPDLWSTGAWTSGLGPLPPLAPGLPLPQILAVAAGAVIAVRGGQFAVGLLMARYRHRVRTPGLPDGGRLIGLLERGLIYALILMGQPVGVGFLIAAKSVLRFGTASKDQKTAEYVIIGTLASFGWALLTAWAVTGLLALLL